VVPGGDETISAKRQALLNELAEESDQVAVEVEFWPVSVDAGNVRNNSPELIVSL
jgi:hypothetical protein